MHASIESIKTKLALPISSSAERHQLVYTERQAAQAEARSARHLNFGYRSPAEHAAKRQRLTHLEEIERQLIMNRDTGRVSIVRGGRTWSRTATAHGALGVDLNIDHLAAWAVDDSGNPVAKPYRIPLKLDGLRASTRDGRMRAAISTLIQVAKAHGVGSIAIEDLGFARERAISREACNKRFRRLMHGFPTAAFRGRLIGMAHRAGLAVVAVDPAYSSIWGASNGKPLVDHPAPG